VPERGGVKRASNDPPGGMAGATRPAIPANPAVIIGPPPLPDKIDLVVGMFGQGVALAVGTWITAALGKSTQPHSRGRSAGAALAVIFSGRQPSSDREVIPRARPAEVSLQAARA
jgi:hypothetical protein